MANVSPDRICDCISRRLQSLTRQRSSQENLLRFAESLGFTLRDVDRCLSHAIPMGGASGRGDVWPLDWYEARGRLNPDHVLFFEGAFRRIVDQFPHDLKEQYPKLFE
jgi:hypothetical protein